MLRILKILLLIFMGSNLFCQSWNNIGNGIAGGMPTCFYSSDKLYIGVNSPAGPSSFSGIAVNGICSLDGSQLDTLYTGVSLGSALDAVWYNGKLIVAGDFWFAGYWPGVDGTTHIAAWDTVTNSWSSVTPNGPCNGDVKAIRVYNGDLYIGGRFTSVDGVSCNRIARWNGSTWFSVGGGVSGWTNQVLCMEVFQNKLIVAGSFGMAGTIPVNLIASWDGTAWDSVGNGFNYDVYDLLTDSVSQTLYACGIFTTADGYVAQGVAKWNGTSWSPVGSGWMQFYGVYCMAIYDSSLVMGLGGSIHVSPQGDTIHGLCTFTDSGWVEFQGGANSAVMELAVHQGDLYIGGIFSAVGYGIPANRIACYGTTCTTSVGIPEQPPPIPFQMFPNPNVDVLHIATQDPSELLFRLYNSAGQLVKEEKFRSQYDYSTKELGAGNYIVQISLPDGSRMHSEQLIVK